MELRPGPYSIARSLDHSQNSTQGFPFMNVHRPMAVATALLFNVVFSATSSAQVTRGNLKVVTLSEARERALSVNPASVAAQGDVDVAAWSRLSAFTDLITPNVSAGTTYAAY